MKINYQYYNNLNGAEYRNKLFLLISDIINIKNNKMFHCLVNSYQYLINTKFTRQLLQVVFVM